MYVFITGRCFGCKKVFTFHPNKVPSVTPPGGEREPICRNCVERVNPTRIENGLDPIVVRDGAYDPAPEEEILW